MEDISYLKRLAQTNGSIYERLLAEISDRAAEIQRLLNEISEISKIGGIGVDLDDLIYKINNLPNYEGESWFSSTRC